VSSRIDDVVVRIAPELNQPLFHFVRAMDICIINVLLHGRAYLIINWAKSGQFRIRGYKSTEQSLAAIYQFQEYNYPHSKCF